MSTSSSSSSSNTTTSAASSSIASSFSQRCDRDQSRKVRGFLHREVYPLLSDAGITATDLPMSCILNPQLDPYIPHEKQKELVRKGDWKCLFCGKHFNSEFYMDRHLHNKHVDQMSVSSTSVCLADMCPIFGCDQSKKNELSRVLPGGKKSNSFSTIQSCTADEVERHNYKCKMMAKRCFGNLQKPDTATGNSIDELFQQRVCEKLRCQNGVLLGSIIELPLPDDPHPNTIIVWWILRYLVIGIIAVFAFFYALSTGLIFGSHRSQKRKKQS